MKMNKIHYSLIFFVIIVSLAVNHKFYGNSNATLSNYEAVKHYLEIQQRKRDSKILADYIYNRIKYYQKYDDWYERTIRHFYIYEKLKEK